MISKYFRGIVATIITALYILGSFYVIGEASFYYRETLGNWSVLMFAVLVFTWFPITVAFFAALIEKILNL